MQILKSNLKSEKNIDLDYLDKLENFINLFINQNKINQEKNYIVNEVPFPVIKIKSKKKIMTNY